MIFFSNSPTKSYFLWFSNRWSKRHKLNQKVNSNPIFFIKKRSNYHSENFIFSNSNSRRYNHKNIKIMRKTWFFVKGYPFDSFHIGSKNFHNHKINWIKSTNSLKLNFSKTISQVKWDVSFKLWWKIFEKVNFKISFSWKYQSFFKNFYLIFSSNFSWFSLKFVFFHWISNQKSPKINSKDVSKSEFQFYFENTL